MIFAILSIFNFVWPYFCYSSHRINLIFAIIHTFYNIWYFLKYSSHFKLYYCPTWSFLLFAYSESIIDLSYLCYSLQIQINNWWVGVCNVWWCWVLQPLWNLRLIEMNWKSGGLEIVKLGKLKMIEDEKQYQSQQSNYLQIHNNFATLCKVIFYK